MLSVLQLGGKFLRRIALGASLPLIFVLFFMPVFNVCHGLTSEERGELARKFKYYHDSVRPTDRFNLIQNANGTFFALNSELEILQTRSDVDDDRRFHVDLQLIVHYNDDRLFLRELPDILHIPDEFRAWTPAIELADALGGIATTGVIGTSGAANKLAPSASAAFAIQKSTFLDPKTGQITVFYRITGSVNCLADAWKYPFERFACKIEFLTEQDERLFLHVMRDLRIDAQRRHVEYFIEEWPNLAVWFEFSREWLFALVDVYVPSLLIFSLALFAQWKRRKVQVLVTIGSILCIVLIKNAQDDSLLRRMGSRLYLNHYQAHGSVTLQDVWLIGLLIHLICLLTIDLLLPSRRIVYAPTVLMSALSVEGSPSKLKDSPTSSQSFRPLLHGSSYSPKRRRTSMPYISSRKHFYTTTFPTAKNKSSSAPVVARRDNTTQPTNIRTRLANVGTSLTSSHMQRHASVAQMAAHVHATMQYVADGKQVRFQSSPYLFPISGANGSSVFPGFSQIDNTSPSLFIHEPSKTMSGDTPFVFTNSSQETIASHQPDNCLGEEPSRPRNVHDSDFDPIYVDATVYQSHEKILNPRSAGIIDASYAAEAELSNELRLRYHKNGVMRLVSSHAVNQRQLPLSVADTQVRTVIRTRSNDKTENSRLDNQQQSPTQQECQQQHRRQQLTSFPPLTVRSTIHTSPTSHYKHVVIESQTTQKQQQNMSRCVVIKEDNSTKSDNNIRNVNLHNNSVNDLITKHNKIILQRQQQEQEQNIKKLQKQQQLRERQQNDYFNQQELVQSRQRCPTMTERQVINGVTSLNSTQSQENLAGDQIVSDTYVMNPVQWDARATMYASSPNVRATADTNVPSLTYCYVRNAHGGIYCPTTAANQLPYTASIPTLATGHHHVSASQLLRNDSDNGHELATQSLIDEEKNDENRENDKPSHHVVRQLARDRISRITMGRKKRRALYGIIFGFVTFVVGYVALVVYAVYG